MCLFCLKGATRGNKSNGVEVTIISSFPEGIAPLTDIVTVPPPPPPSSSSDGVIPSEIRRSGFDERGRLKEEAVGWMGGGGGGAEIITSWREGDRWLLGGSPNFPRSARV